LQATEAVQDGPSWELAAAQQAIEELEEELTIKKRWSAKLGRRLDKCKSEPETMEHTDISPLPLEKDMLLHQVKNLSSEQSSLEFELIAFECVIQSLTTNQVHATMALHTAQPPACLCGIRGSSEPTSG
jgi:hypothetical protein